MAEAALSMPNRFSPLRKNAVSGEFRYFGCASPSALPPNAMISPRALEIGNMILFAKSGRGRDLLRVLR